jgi:hypothetical protein
MYRKQSLIDISILLKIYLKAADSNNANRDCSQAHCGQQQPLTLILPYLHISYPTSM